MTVVTKTIGRLPVNLGDYDNTKSYGRKNRVFLYGCEFESLMENNTYIPMTWDGAETFTEDTVHWKRVSGSPEAWIAGQDKPSTSEEYPYNGMGRVVLKKNMVGGVNTLTQAAFEDSEGNDRGNTIYVIQYDFTLGEDITVPANCVLEFDGGSISGNYAIDFTNLKTQYIYASWMSVDVLAKSIEYMSHHTLIVDKKIELSQPLSNENKHYLSGFEIKGIARTKYIENYTKGIIAFNDCTALHLCGYNIKIDNIDFTPIGTSTNNPIVILDTSSENNTDLDSIVSNCTFDSLQYGTNNVIVSYGRGLTVDNCEFEGSTTDSFIKCYMKTSNNPAGNKSLWDKYGGRKFWFHHNQLHGNGGHFIYIAKNNNAPNAVFNGVRIENNNSDIGGSLIFVDALCNGLSIINNSFIGERYASKTFISLTDVKNVLISNNIFTGIDDEDVASGRNNDKNILFNSTGGAVENVNISNNIFTVIQNAILFMCDIKGLIVADNIFTNNSFSNGNARAIVRTYRSLQNAEIKGNVFNGNVSKSILFAAYIGTDAYKTPTMANILLNGNVGVAELVVPDDNIATWAYSNIRVLDIENPESLSGDRKKLNLESFVGSTYFDSTQGVEKPVYYTGSGWVYADGTTVS